jgi:hypothetical protein
VTSEQPADLEERVVVLERRIALLESRLARWAANGLEVADSGSVFAGYGGASGTSPRFKRSDA